MDYRFFEALTPEEARTYLERFLTVESEAIEETLDAARADGVQADFSVESVPEFFSWLGPKVNVAQVPAPTGVEWWVSRAMEEHHGGFLDLDDASRHLALRAAYYLGQSFVSSHENLGWGFGRRDRIEFQQPVVTGFRTGADLPALVVAENVLLDAKDPEFQGIARRAVSSWSEAV
jgi:hypothetical protein